MLAEDKKVWYIDSGCFRHMTRNKRALKNYIDCKGSKVAFGDSSKGSTRGKWTIFKDNMEIHDVSYVEGLKYNL